MKRPRILQPLLLLLSSPMLIVPALPVWAGEQGEDSYLELDLAQLMQVTLTSAAKKEQSLDETAAAAFVITSSDIKRSTATSIPELLAMAPGIQVAQIANGKWSVSSRGFGGYTSNKLLVMIDGRSVYTPAYSGTYWDMQNVLLEDVDRIEVIRGPGGTLWGANAVNGVINIITKKAQDTQGTLVRGSGGTKEYNGAVRYGTPIGEKSFGRFFAFGTSLDNNELDDGSGSANDDWENIQAGFRFDGITDAKNDWTLSGDVYQNSGDQIVNPYLIPTPPYSTVYDDDYDASGANLNGIWRHQFNDEDRLTVSGYLDYTDREEVFLTQTFTTFNLDLQYETLIGDNHSLTTGLGYRHIDSSFDNTFQVHVEDSNRDLYSAFIQDEIELVEQQLWLTIGSKFEYNEYTDAEWQPSARILYKPKPNHSLWTSVARAVRTPSQIERDGQVTIAVSDGSNPFIPAGIPFYLAGSSDFDSEEVIAYEAGYRWQAKSNLSFDIATYYNSYDKIYASTFDGMGLTFANAVDGEGYGVELAANWQPNNWLTFNLAYSWQELDLGWRNDSYATNTAGNIFEDALPEHLLTLRSQMVFSPRWQANMSLRYTDEISAYEATDLDNPIEISSWWQLNANITWKATENFELKFAGRNIFNDDELQSVSEFVTPGTDIEADFYIMGTWSF